MNPDEYRVLLNRLDSLQKTVDRIDRDLGQDRKDIENFTLRLGSVENVIDELRDSVRRQADKIKDRVEDIMEPMRLETQDLKETIESKKTIPIGESKKKHWWQ